MLLETHTSEDLRSSLKHIVSMHIKNACEVEREVGRSELTCSLFCGDVMIVSYDALGLN